MQQTAQGALFNQQRRGMCPHSCGIVTAVLGVVMMALAIVCKSEADLSSFFSQTVKVTGVTLNSCAVGASIYTAMNIFFTTAAMFLLKERNLHRINVMLSFCTLIPAIVSVGCTVRSSPDDAVVYDSSDIQRMAATVDDIQDVAELKDACGGNVFACDYDPPGAWIGLLVIAILTTIALAVQTFLAMHAYKRFKRNQAMAAARAAAGYDDPPPNNPPVQVCGNVNSLYVPPQQPQLYGQAAVDSVFCRYCGKRIKADDVFCPACGKRQVAQASAPPEPEEGEAPPYPSDDPPAYGGTGEGGDAPRPY